MSTNYNNNNNNYNNNSNNNNNNNHNKYNCTSVAIVGIGFRIPSGELNSCNDSTNKLWNNLINKFDGVVETKSRWSDNFNRLDEIANKYSGLLPMSEIKSFDPLFFSMNPKEVSNCDPQQRLLLKCTWEALEDAGIDPSKLRGSNSSVYIGSSCFDYQVANLKNDNEIHQNIFATTLHTLSNKISNCFDLRGESMTVETACSSSLNATYLGYNSIVEGRSTVSIVGGSNIIFEPHYSKGYSNLGMLSKTGRCKSFDIEADGYVRGETIAVLILKNLKNALEDGDTIYCTIDGASSNVDGNQEKSNFYSPSKLSQHDNIKKAISSTKGRVLTSDIDFVETHGTGTPTGDPIELGAINMVFDRNNKKQLLIGSFKSNIGHCEAASGVASLVKCCLMFKNKCFAPNIHFKTPNPSIKFDEWNLKVVTETTPFSCVKNDKDKVSMAIFSYGITGSNCCLVLSQYHDQKEDVVSTTNDNQPKKQYLIPVSANSVKSLQLYQSALISQFKSVSSSSPIEFSNIIQSQINNKILKLSQRSILIAHDQNDFNNSLVEKYKTNNDKPSNFASSNKVNPFTIVYVFCGQGSQYNKMALELYINEPTFKSSMDELDGKFYKYYGYSVLKKLFSLKDNDLNGLHQQNIAQPSTCIVQVSLFKLFSKQWGIKPSFIIGHSLGEITSAYCSGMIDIDTLCYLVYRRSILQAKTNGAGKMLSINISANEFNSLYSSKYPTVEIACFNSPWSIVIGGKEKLLIEISNDLKSNGIFSAFLGSLTSFHTSSQNKIKNEILRLNFKSQVPCIPTFSTVTSNLFKDTSPPSFNSEYIFDNISKPVLFSQTISNLYKHIQDEKLGSQVVFIEIAPHSTLSYYLKQMIPTPQSLYFSKDSVTIYSPLNKKKNDITQIQQTISELYCQGYNSINFNCQFNSFGVNQKFKRVNLPNYKWDDQEYFKEDSNYAKHKLNGPSINILGTSIKQSHALVKSYSTTIDINKKPFAYLQGHQVSGKFYFPGCGYIDNVLKLYGNQDLTIEFVEFLYPLIFTKDVNVSFQTNIYQTGKNEYRSVSHFKDNETNEWLNSCNIGFQLFDHGINAPTLTFINGKSIDEIVNNQCNLTKLNTNELYSHIKNKTELSYTGSFQSVLQCNIGDGCSLAEISLKISNDYCDDNNLYPSSPTSFFNTPTLDSCLHGMIVLIEDHCKIVFEKVEGLTFYHSNIPSNRIQHSSIFVYSFGNSKSGESFSSSLLVFLKDGTILIEIEKVFCKSTIEITDPMTIHFPKNEIYTEYLQPKESQIGDPSTFKHEIILNNDQDSQLVQDYNGFISSLFYNEIIKREPKLTLKKIKSKNINEIKSIYFKQQDKTIKYEKLFEFIFETIKNNEILPLNLWNESNLDIYNNLVKSTNIIMNLLFPQKQPIDTIKLNDDTKIKHGLIDSNFYSNQIKLISRIVKKIINPMINEKLVFRILEFGYGGIESISSEIIKTIETLLEMSPTFEIDIEYTFSDPSLIFIENLKSKISKNNTFLNIIYKVLDLDKPLLEQGQELNPSYYDLVLISSSLHNCKNVIKSLTDINRILSPNGQLLILESSKSTLMDCLFGVTDKWWALEDSLIRGGKRCMNKNTFLKLLTHIGFKDVQFIGDQDENAFIIQTQKPTINLKEKSIFSYSNVIIYGNNDDEGVSTSISKSIQFNKLILTISNSNIIIISTIEQFEELIKNIDIQGTNSIILFTKSIDPLTVGNFKDISFEFIKLNQIILNLKYKCKHVLVTNNSRCDNFLASSLVGAARYFEEFSMELNLFTLDIDNETLQQRDGNSIISIIEYITDLSKNIQREYIIKENKMYYLRVRKERNPNENIFTRSISYIDIGSDSNSIITNLKSNQSEFKIDTKKPILGPNEIEVKVMATGINYKDYLYYTSILSRPSNKRNELGLEFSGIVTRLGSKIDEFKIGDHVFGKYGNSISSHIVVNALNVGIKPSNISFNQAATIPIVYLTSMHGIYEVGGLNENQSILIHSATGGVGLSALEVLKWKGHKGEIFVTVGSKEKKDYLLKTYGTFITGIYSSRDKCYVTEIKMKQRELGSSKNGVHLILNTLSSEYMDSNFKCLSKDGGAKIIDLSVTHLNSNEYLNYRIFKYNIGYHNIEIEKLPEYGFKKILNELSSVIQDNKLRVLPITEYPILDFKKAIETINERKHIGKIVVSHDVDICSKLILENPQSYKNKIIKPNYQIDQHLGETILLTGQSGIILEILKWIIQRSLYYSSKLKNIIILSKSKLKWELELLINKYKNTHHHSVGCNGIKFYFKSCDISDTKSVDETLDELLINNPSITNIDSIFHYAFSQMVKKVNEIDLESLNITHGAKTLGAINLHDQSIKRGWKLKNFITASSMTAQLGSTNQCGYVCANNVLDSFSRYRKSIGLPTICTNYGAIGSTGFLSRNESISLLLDGQGVNKISINTILGALDLQIQNQSNCTNLILCDFDFSGLYRQYKNCKSISNKLDYQINLEENKIQKETSESVLDVKQRFLIKLSQLLSINESKINLSLKLVDFGGDSLLAVQLFNWISKEISPNLITIQQLQNESINTTIKLINI